MTFCDQPVKGKKFPPLALAASLSFLVALYAPLELFFTNRDDFWFDFTSLLPCCLAMFAGCWAAGAILLLFLRRWPRLYGILLTLGLAVLLSLYIQGNFLVNGLPIMNGDAVEWSHFGSQRIASLIAWVLPAAALLLLGFKKGFALVETLTGWASLVLIGVLLPTLITVALQTGAYKPSQYFSSTYQGIEDYSTKKNVVVLMLDSVDGNDFSRVLNEDPAHAKALRDFTYYDNATAAYSYTFYSAAFILGGEWYENAEPFADYRSRMLQTSPLLNELKAEGYSMGYYSPDATVDIAKNSGLFINMRDNNPEVGSKLGLAKTVLQMAGVQYAPFDLKRFCYTLPADLDWLKSGDGDSTSLYTWRMTEFYWLTKELTDYMPHFAAVEQPTFKFIHLEGGHSDFKYLPDLNPATGADATYDNMLRASLFTVENYLDMLREKGVYDNTAIVILADHGYNVDPETQVVGRYYHQHGIVLAKGFGESHDFTTNSAPISYADLQPAFLRLLAGKSSDALFDWHEGDARERRFLDYFVPGNPLTEYIQTGFAGDRSTFHPTGTVYDSPPDA